MGIVRVETVRVGIVRHPSGGGGGARMLLNGPYKILFYSCQGRGAHRAGRAKSQTSSAQRGSAMSGGVAKASMILVPVPQ